MINPEHKEEDTVTKPTPIVDKLVAKGCRFYGSKAEDFLLDLSNAELIGLFKEVSGDAGDYGLQNYVVHGFFALPQERLVGILSTHTMELIQTLDPNRKYNFTDSLFKLDKAILSQILTSDNVLGLFRNIEPRDVREFIDNLFSLPKDIIQPLIATHKIIMLAASGTLKGYFAIKLLQSFPQLEPEPATAITPDNVLKLAAESGVYQSSFIRALLELPAKQLDSIVTHGNMATLFSKSEWELVFIHKLLELPKETIDNLFTPSNMQEVFAWILKPNYRHATTNQKLLDAFKAQGLKLPMEVTKDLDFSNDQDLIFLKLATSAIDFIEQDRIKDLDPLVVQLLSKTHVQVANTEAGRSFANSWIDGLNKIIQANPSLTMILQNAAKACGDIFVTNSEYIKTSNSDSAGGFLNPQDLTIGIANGINNPVHALDILIHEATHKLIQNIYQNDMLPYHKGCDSDFTVIKEAMSAEAAKEKELYSRLYIDKWREAGLSVGDKLPPEALGSLTKESWMKTMIDSYSQDKLAIEILPWFTQQIARHILGNQEFGDVGREFAEHLWGYLNQYFTPRQDPEPLPPFCYQDYVDYASIPDEEGSLTYNAKKLVITSEPSIRWLDDEVGQLAFQSLPPSDQRAFINELFVSPERGLDKSNVVKVFEHSSVPSYDLIDKLFALPNEKLLSIVTHDNIHPLISLVGDFKLRLIDKLFALPNEKLISIVTHDNIHSLISQLGDFKFIFIDKLFALPPENIQLIVTADNVEALINASGDFKSILIDKLFALPNEKLFSIVTHDNIHPLISLVGDFKLRLIDKLFALPNEKLLSIVTHDNIHSLISQLGDFKFIFIDKILALAPEDLVSVITHDNFAIIQDASGIYAYKLQGLLPPSPDEPEAIVQSENELPFVENAECALVAELPNANEYI